MACTLPWPAARCADAAGCLCRAQYFVSSGFAFVHADSTTDVCAVEAVPLEQLDGDAVKQGLADYQAKLMNAKDDYEKAAAQVGIEVCSAMNAALGG